MKKKTILITLVVLLSAIFGVIFAYGPNPDIEKLKEGDVIFHASDSRQAPMLRLATSSPITHCGIIIEKGGKLYVLDWAHATQGNASADAARTFLTFNLSVLEVSIIDLGDRIQVIWASRMIWPSSSRTRNTIVRNWSMTSTRTSSASRFANLVRSATTIPWDWRRRSGEGA